MRRSLRIAPVVASYPRRRGSSLADGGSSHAVGIAPCHRWGVSPRIDRTSILAPRSTNYPGSKRVRIETCRPNRNESGSKLVGLIENCPRVPKTESPRDRRTLTNDPPSRITSDSSDRPFPVVEATFVRITYTPLAVIYYRFEQCIRVEPLPQHGSVGAPTHRWRGPNRVSSNCQILAPNHAVGNS